jgi:hypothetical protein
MSSHDARYLRAYRCILYQSRGLARKSSLLARIDYTAQDVDTLQFRPADSGVTIAKRIASASQGERTGVTIPHPGDGRDLDPREFRPQRDLYG